MGSFLCLVSSINLHKNKYEYHSKYVLIDDDILYGKKEPIQESNSELTQELIQDTTSF